MSEDLTTKLKRKAKELNVDLIGIASIDRFKEVPPHRHPASIFPEVKSVIVVGKRITRGALRGVEEGTQFNIYRLYGYSWLEDRFLAYVTYELTRFLEDNGWEAVPLPGLPPEIPPMGVPTRKGQPPPNVLIDPVDAAVRAGLGEIGYCNILLTPEFGPLQRVQVILTDANLKPDPIQKQRLCDEECPRFCAKLCPLGAIHIGKEKEVIICGKRMVVAEIDYSKCRICKNGALPNRAYPLANPDRLAALCVRSCLDYLERTGKLKRKFRSPFRKRPPWALDELGRYVKLNV